MIVVVVFVMSRKSVVLLVETLFRDKMYQKNGKKKCIKIGEKFFEKYAQINNFSFSSFFPIAILSYGATDSMKTVKFIVTYSMHSYTLSPYDS